MGIRLLLLCAQSNTISAHYRERSLCVLRADVTKTGKSSVENSEKIGLVRHLGMRAGGVGGFGKAESEAPPLFQMNLRGRIISKRGLSSE